MSLARRNGIDVLLNSESKRETPSYVNFGAKQVSSYSTSRMCLSTSFPVRESQ